VDDVEAEGSDKKFVPPYNVPWATVINHVEKMEKGGVPDRIDRSYLSGVAGGIQPYLIGAFRQFGFIDENGFPQPVLHDLVSKPDARKEIISGLLRRYYPKPTALGETNSTLLQLDEAFKEEYGQEGATREKAKRFFLAAAQWADLPLSPNWKVKASGPKSGSAGRTSRRTPAQPQIPRVDRAAGDTHSVDLKSGGTVTLSVSVNLFELDREDRDYVLELVDRLKGYVVH
jgi:hypothetical protein